METLLAAEPASRLAAGGFTRWRPTDVDTVSRSQRGFHNLGIRAFGRVAGRRHGQALW